MPSSSADDWTTVRPYPLPDQMQYHSWISRSERELHRLRGWSTLTDPMRAHNSLGSNDDSGEDDALRGREEGNVDTINLDNMGMMHNNGEQPPSAYRYAHRINMFEICNELLSLLSLSIVESVNEEHLVANVLRQLYPNNHGHFATAYLDEHREIGICFKLKYDGQIKARIVCTGR